MKVIGETCWLVRFFKNVFSGPIDFQYKCITLNLELFSLFFSADVGSFLKIDENQNEELDENLLCLTHPRSSLAEETQYVLFRLPFFGSQAFVWLFEFRPFGPPIAVCITNVI